MTPDQHDLINAGLRWVTSTRRRILPATNDQMADDLDAEGRLALTLAALRYEPEQGEWHSWAINLIRHAMLDMMRRQASHACLSTRMVRLEQARMREMAAQLGRPPTAEEMGVTDEHYAYIQPRIHVSCEAAIWVDGETMRLGDAIADEGADTERDALERVEASWLWEAVDELREPDRSVIVRHFADGEPLRAIGRSMGLSESRTHQIKQRGIQYLREAFGC